MLIANRGEIARRIIRTCAGWASPRRRPPPADHNAPHAREAERVVEIDSYLNIDAVVEACGVFGATALHPGYGFLSENPTLARACADAGIAFVGPPAAAMEMLGDKIAGKRLAHAMNVPVVPAFSEEEARSDSAPYPLLIKAAAGGGDAECASSSARRN